MIANLLRHNLIDRFDLQQTYPILDQTNSQSLWLWSKKKEEEIEVVEEEKQEEVDEDLDRLDNMTYEELEEQIETPLYDRTDTEKERLSDEKMIAWMEEIPLDVEQAGWD